jgi:hypothetical protein
LPTHGRSALRELQPTRQVNCLHPFLSSSFVCLIISFRYGATQALGIACAATANKEALDLLEPLASDPVDFVRQGALIALAMVLIQVSKAQEPRVESIRKMFEEKITDKHEEVMCKFGAIIASGIIDAGGRNVTIALHSRSGHKSIFLPNLPIYIFNVRFL